MEIREKRADLKIIVDSSDAKSSQVDKHVAGEERHTTWSVVGVVGETTISSLGGDQAVCEGPVDFSVFWSVPRCWLNKSLIGISWYGIGVVPGLMWIREDGLGNGYCDKRDKIRYGIKCFCKKLDAREYGRRRDKDE
jgi:hypothetical protein